MLQNISRKTVLSHTTVKELHQKRIARQRYCLFVGEYDTNIELPNDF
jgi:hypothetical protein